MTAKEENKNKTQARKTKENILLSSIMQYIFIFIKAVDGNLDNHLYFAKSGPFAEKGNSTGKTIYLFDTVLQYYLFYLETLDYFLYNR